jgi:hypothetical protein
MKYLPHLLLALALALGGYLAVAHVSGGAFYTFGLPLGGEEGWLRRRSLEFWEDIQFKDFDKAATYHSPDQQSQVDIPFLLERLFLVKPEGLDIMQIEVVMVDIDSTGNRARVKTRLQTKVLVDGKIREREIMLYYHRASAAEPWFMELESSLRTLEGEKDKKH